jgi:hypothetical protein
MIPSCGVLNGYILHKMRKETSGSERAVSVCVPTFNGAPFVGEAIRSVLDQTFEDSELIVIDDDSSDGTPDVVAAFSDDRLRFVRNETRLGLVGNWNRCLDSRAAATSPCSIRTTSWRRTIFARRSVFSRRIPRSAWSTRTSRGSGFDVSSRRSPFAWPRNPGSPGFALSVVSASAS